MLEFYIVVFAIGAVGVMGGLYVKQLVADAIELRRSDASAKRWSSRRRRAKALRAAEDDARRAVEDALARAQVVRERDPR